MKTLIIAEHDGKALSANVSKVVQAAMVWNLPIEVLVVGHDIAAVANQAAQIAHVTKVLTADADHLAPQLAEDVSALVQTIGRDYRYIAAAHSSFSRNILPRAAALLDVSMISDVLEILADNTYTRSIYAGNVIATVQSSDPIQVMTIHASNFEAAATSTANADIQAIPVAQHSHDTKWVSKTLNVSDRPPLASAKIVVSGGRSLGSAEQFEKLLDPLARKLNAALGATRAAVDAGFAPNDIQVGQTGVVVAPELYIAVGVSGAVQHIYGMKESKVVIAINSDPDAPIFQYADYGLVADLFEAVPALTSSVQQ